MTNLFNRSVFLVLLKVLASGLALLYYYLLARQLSVLEFGLFSLAMSCLVFSTAFAKQGLEQAIVRFVGQEQKQSIRKLYIFTLIYSGISALIIALIIYFLSPSISSSLLSTPVLSTLIPLVALLTIIQTWLSINSSALKGSGYAASSLLFTGSITFLLALIQFIYKSPEVAIDAMTQLAIAAMLSCVVSFVFTLTKLDLSKSSNIFEPKPFLATSKSLFLISLAALATQQLGTLVLASYASLESVAIFSLSLKISLLVSYLLIAVNSITAPQYAKYYKDGELLKFKSLAIQSNKLLLIGATLSVLILYLLVGEIIYVFGEKYYLATEIVRILLIGQWINLATGSVVSMLIMAGFEKIHRRNTLILTSLNIVALFLLIPEYGIIAAAWITTVAMASKNLVSLYFVRRLIFSKVEPVSN